MTAKLWLMGEALIDFIPITSDLGPGFVPRTGGSPFNAAKAAAQAGSDVGFLGAISTDMFGELLLADLAQYGVDTAQAPVVSDPTTLAFVALTDGVAKYAFFNTATATALMAPAKTGFVPAAGDVLSVGSISLIDAPGADNIARYALDHAGPGGAAMLAIDPNARPTMTPDVAAWRDRITTLTSVAGLVHVSDEDLELLAPGQSPEDYAKARLDEGVGLVVVTLGDRGVLGFSPAGRVQVSSPRVQVADTVGAGDTIMGSLLADLMTRGLTTKPALSQVGTDTLGQMLTYAAMAAAINCESDGCAPPHRDTVLARLDGASS